MTPAARFLALLVGFAGLVFAAAGMVREVVLAADGAGTWPLAGWWERITGEPSWATTGVAAAVAAGIGVTLVVLALRQSSGMRRGPAFVDFGDDDGRARLEVAALERALRRRLEMELPGMRTRDLSLGKAADGWGVRVEADMPARDLVGLQEAAVALIAADLERVGGLRLVGVDIVVTRLIPMFEDAA